MIDGAFVVPISSESVLTVPLCVITHLNNRVQTLCHWLCENVTSGQSDHELGT
jgi:hypothetical protein